MINILYCYMYYNKHMVKILKMGKTPVNVNLLIFIYIRRSFLTALNEKKEI